MEASGPAGLPTGRIAPFQAAPSACCILSNLTERQEEQGLRDATTVAQVKALPQHRVCASTAASLLGLNQASRVRYKQ